LWRENQRISLRAFLRSLLSNPQIAETKAIQEFLTFQPITPSDEDVIDISRRKAMDEKRVEEQKQFYEIARKRAAELDIYMEEYFRVSWPLDNITDHLQVSSGHSGKQRPHKTVPGNQR
jgi:hypothetical protein